MKKYSRIAYIVIMLIILVFGFSIYKVFAKNGTNEDIKSKSLAEVKYLENKFSNLFNQVNNISFENYKISSSEIKKEEAEQQLSNSSGSSGNGGGSSGQSKQGESESSSDSKTSENSEASKDNKQYELKETGVLTKDSEIDWNQIKNEVEKIYTSLYPTTLDLYQTETNNEDIINLNKEYDNLTRAVKDENKDDTLLQLSKLYDYLPKFVENCTDDEKNQIIIKTKNDIFKAYSILDQEEWTTISKNVNDATQEFTKLVTSVNNQEKGNQYNINKAYVMMNELQNAVVLKDKEVFLIKYKNLLEELQNI